jgi:hypothetical protein
MFYMISPFQVMKKSLVLMINTGNTIHTATGYGNERGVN